MKTLASGFALLLLAVPAHAQNTADRAMEPLDRLLGAGHGELARGRAESRAARRAPRIAGARPGTAAGLRRGIAGRRRHVHARGSARRHRSSRPSSPMARIVRSPRTAARGTQRAEWSADGLRLYARAELTCKGDQGFAARVRSRDARTGRQVDRRAVGRYLGTRELPRPAVSPRGRHAASRARYRGHGADARRREGSEREGVAARAGSRARRDARLVRSHQQASARPGRRRRSRRASSISSWRCRIPIDSSSSGRHPSIAPTSPIIDDPFMVGWAFGYPVWSDCTASTRRCTVRTRRTTTRRSRIRTIRGTTSVAAATSSTAAAEAAAVPQQPSGRGRVVDGQGYTRVTPRGASRTNAIPGGSTASSSGGGGGGSSTSSSSSGSSGGGGACRARASRAAAVVATAVARRSRDRAQRPTPDARRPTIELRVRTSSSGVGTWSRYPHAHDQLIRAEDRWLTTARRSSRASPVTRSSRLRRAHVDKDSSRARRGGGRGPRPECVNPKIPAAECNIGATPIQWAGSGARRRTVRRRIRGSRASQSSRRRHGEVSAAVVDRVPARRQHLRHRASRSAPHHSQRRARPEPGRRRARGACAGAAGADGRRPAPALRGEQVGLHRVSQAACRNPDAPPTASGAAGDGRRDDADARHVEWHRARRREGHLRIRRDAHRVVADRIRPRRHALHVDQRVRHRARTCSAPPIRTTTPARPCASATTGPSRRTIRSSTSPATSRRSTRSATATDTRWRSIPRPGEFWVTEQGPNGGDEINVLKAGANYGWPYVSHGRNYMGPKISENPWRQDFERRRSCGCRRSPWPEGRSTPATGFPAGSEASSSAACARAKRRAPGRCSASSSTTSGRRSAASRCCASCISGFATFAKGPDGLLYVVTGEDQGALLRIEPGEPVQ